MRVVVELTGIAAMRPRPLLRVEDVSEGGGGSLTLDAESRTRAARKQRSALKKLHEEASERFDVLPPLLLFNRIPVHIRFHVFFQAGRQIHHPRLTHVLDKPFWIRHKSLYQMLCVGRHALVEIQALFHTILDTR